MRSSDNRSSFLFFVAWVLIGKFTLLSLFLAVIMEAFEVAHERIVAEHALAMQDALLGTAPPFPATDVGPSDSGANTLQAVVCVSRQRLASGHV